ncbi:hypothetical protein CTI12_AA552520 [Artemisia annua]|uniref:F-box domain-containing protein n=1 Tax=Artemisia annua TaxID=35608 RepID=A0A2U1KXZ4_ARTAN|nr:hypothetical protein CTI12_AA552520 [Artemisia annua]
MEQKQVSCGSVLPPLSAKYTWLVAQSLEDEKNEIGDLFFYTIHDPLINYRCSLPELLGKRIRGYYHGWYILSKKTTWSLWNPITSKFICLPPLILKDGDSGSIKECCLSLPPADPSSILLLTRTDKATFVFFRLAGKRKSKTWTEVSYAEQLEDIIGPSYLLHSLTCCSGNVYALNEYVFYCQGILVILVEIVVKDKEVVINLRLIGKCPKFDSYYEFFSISRFLTGSSSELFHIIVGFDSINDKVGAVHLFKLDMNRVEWNEMVDADDMYKACQIFEEMKDLKDTTFFVSGDLKNLKDTMFLVNSSVFYRPVISSELGGYIHIRDNMAGKDIIHSYHVKDRTISLSSSPSPVVPTSHVLLWECRLEDDHGEDGCRVDSKQTENEIVVRGVVDNLVKSNESYMLNLPFDMLVMIMDRCIGVEYMNFRLTCKRCHLAARVIKWRDQAEIKRLQNYSLISPWLMVVDQNRGVITFTDPIFGNNYFINSHVSIYGGRICCSGYGWLLFYSTDFYQLVFFNPFTNNLIKLPQTECDLRNLCFSAPPISPNCIVVGFEARNYSTIYIHNVGGEPSWLTLDLVDDSYFIYSLSFPTFSGGDLYALCDHRKLCVFKNLGKKDCLWKLVVAEAPGDWYESSSQYILTKCDQHLILIIVSEVGKSVEVFKLNDVEEEWEKIDDLGRYMIYICDAACFCVEAKTPEMENKIYFPNLHSKNGKIVFYSLETCKYHTFSEKRFDEDLMDFTGTTHHLNPHAWIEPSWS